MGLKGTAIIIPSLEPDENLLKLLAEINSYNKDFDIMIVNDGSSSQYDPIFEQACTYEKVTVLTHGVNKGKGRALKTAFEHLLNHFPNIQVAITIDSDGQHTYEDMIKCLNVYNQKPDSIIFGSRNFKNGENIPLRSKFGNRLTSNVVDSVIGNHLEDTQTGLRVIPSQYFDNLLEVDGERFEYEMNMIIYAQLNNIKIIEVPIKTIYLNENKGSHFNTLKDSLLVYQVFLNYLIASIIVFSIDVFTFYLLISNINQVSVISVSMASIFARAVSLIFKWLLNRFWVFKNFRASNLKFQRKETLIRTFISVILVNFIFFNFETFDLFYLKVIIDVLLIFISLLT